MFGLGGLYNWAKNCVPRPMIIFRIFVINDVYLPHSMLTNSSKTQTVWGFLQFQVLPLLVPYVVTVVSSTCPLHICFCTPLVTTIVTLEVAPTPPIQRWQDQNEKSVESEMLLLLFLPLG